MEISKVERTAVNKARTQAPPEAKLTPCRSLVVLASTPMHHLIIGPRKVVTACGIRIAAHYPMSKTACPADISLENINCTPAPDSERIEITCPKCRRKTGRDAA